MADRFTNEIDTTASASRAPFAITPHDTNALPWLPKRIFVGTGGNVTLCGVDGAADVVYKNLANGVYLNVRPQYIRATGTTAADIVGEG